MSIIYPLTYKKPMYVYFKVENGKKIKMNMNYNSGSRKKNGNIIKKYYKIMLGRCNKFVLEK